MSARALRLVLIALAFCAAEPAAACTLTSPTDESMRPLRLADMPDGLSGAVMRCGAREMKLQVWTLAVDGAAASLGIRDEPLFSADRTGPLTRLISAKVEAAGQVAVFERRETAALSQGGDQVRRQAFRRFATFCDGRAGADPLDCSLGAARVKARVSVRHADEDGIPDVGVHEISVYDGADRLQVISFIAPYAASPVRDVALWIEVLNAASDVLLMQ